MNDYGISKVFHKWSDEKKQILLNDLKVLGVNDEDDLKKVTLEDLMEDCKLSKLDARTLLQHWEKSKFHHIEFWPVLFHNFSLN